MWINYKAKPSKALINQNFIVGPPLEGSVRIHDEIEPGRARRCIEVASAQNKRRKFPLLYLFFFFVFYYGNSASCDSLSVIAFRALSVKLSRSQLPNCAPNYLTREVEISFEGKKKKKKKRPAGCFQRGRKFPTPPIWKSIRACVSQR